MSLRGDDAAEGGWPTIAEREAALLAPYAVFSREAGTRRRPEPEHPYRGPFQRDRDRILHSAAFRRLSGKTQVITGPMGDYHRTRLTHTMEVASIARTIGRALRLNEDLVEALALLHDLGHPPFGHAGEDALAECLAEQGGFSHNKFALTLVERLEWRYHEEPGLNLTPRVLESQTARVDKAAGPPWPTLEAQVVDAADSITYDAHDADDAVKLRLVRLEELAEIPLVAECLAQTPDWLCLSPRARRKALVHQLIDRQVNDLLTRTSAELIRRRFASSDQARQSEFHLAPSHSMAARKRELERFLFERVYRHPEIVRVRELKQRQLHALFAALCDRPATLPEEHRRRIEEVGLARAVGDYLAGMTDRFCDARYAELVGS